MSVQVISDELAARLDNMTPETRSMRFGKVLQNLQTALNDEIAEGPMIYLGAWNALTNTPTLADGAGANGNTYRVSVGGTQDLGSGNLTFAADDRVIYNGTTWEKWDANDAVQSVFSRTGAVTAQAGDYAAFYQSKLKTAQLSDTQATNTPGATSTGGFTYDKRNLQTKDHDADSIVTVASNEFTPVAGDYIIKVRAAGYKLSHSRLKLRNETAGTNVKFGDNCYMGATDAQIWAELSTRFTANGTDAYAIYQAATSAQAAGYGLPINESGVSERYLVIKLLKI